MKEADELNAYDCRENPYDSDSVTNRVISELMDSNRNDICNDNDGLFGFQSLSRHTTTQTLNILSQDDIRQVLQDPDPTYSVPDSESFDEFDAITEHLPSRKSSSTSVYFDYYATIKSVANFLSSCNSDE